MVFTKQLLDDQLTPGDLGQTEHYSEPEGKQASKSAWGLGDDWRPGREEVPSMQLGECRYHTQVLFSQLPICVLSFLLFHSNSLGSLCLPSTTNLRPLP